MNDIIIVSGLPRSGTSLMMQMLMAGGAELLVDGVRTADTDNPRGYYEYEKVKRLRRDNAWVIDAEGKAIKVVSGLLRYLPKECTYRVIFMLRDIVEILASQRVMLGRGVAGLSQGASDDVLLDLAESHIASVREWLVAQLNFRTLFVRYKDVIESPFLSAAEVDRFLGGELDEEGMIIPVDQLLYRQRGGDESL